jgi:hypothetical protein
LRKWPAATALLLPAAICLEGPPPAAPRGWSYYAFDDFEGNALRPRWQVINTEASVSGGKVWLTNRNDADGLLALKGLYRVDVPRVFLFWPWSVETRVSFPPPGGAAYDAGILIKVGNRSGWSADIEAGRFSAFGGTSAYYSAAGRRTAVPYANGLDHAGGLELRVESVGNDQQTVHIGVKAAGADAWTWSPLAQLAQKVDYAEPLALRNGRLRGLEPTGEKVTVGFDFVRFEGRSFQPGILFSEKGGVLDSLSEVQREAMKKAGLSVEYRRPNLAPVAQAEPAGDRYQAHIPDTLDIAERTALSLNAITETVDPTADYEPYCHIYANPEGWNHFGSQYNPDMERRAPVMTHDFHGYNTGIGEGWIEDMPLLRVSSGSTQNLAVSQKMFHNMRRMLGEDGLPAFPLARRPWALFVAWWIDDPITGHSPDRDLTMSGEFAWGRFLSSLAAWYAATGNAQLRSEIERTTLAFRDLDRADPGRPVASPVLYGLVQAYRVTGFGPARDLAGTLLERTRARHFRPDGSFRGHFHDTTFRILAMAQLGALTHDAELLGFARKAYEYARTQGWPLVGFYPETTGQVPATQETCALSHMPGIAATLSLAGEGDYWDDIDRLARNQLVENQLTDYAWLYKLAGQIPDYHAPTPEHYDGIRDVGRRLAGSFAGFASANDYFMPFNRAPGPTVGCCTGNGARALYYVWEHILGMRGGSVSVNLLLNRASAWADVDSYIPYEGRVDIHMKTTGGLKVRIPDWVELDQVQATAAGRPVQLSWEGRYAKAGRAPNGQTVTFTFPIRERTVRQRIGTVDATVRLRGSTVISMEPPGRYRPLYQRAAYAGPTRWKTVVRFAPQTTIDW